MEHMDIWQKVCRPPETALKKIIGGRLQGMTDINPQWRLRAMTEVFGPCGIGWKWAIDKLWTEPGPSGEVMAFAQVHVWTREQEGDGRWSDPIPGIGGSALVAKERDGLRANDEAYKMAVTDALSVALKCLGVASDIYERKWDGSKYRDEAPTTQLEGPKRLERPPAQPSAPPPLTLTGGSFEDEYGRLVNQGEIKSLMVLIDKHGISTDALKTFCQERWGVSSRKELRVGMLPVLSEWAAASGKAVA